MIESPSLGWTPFWAMPNLTLDEPIEASHAALVPTGDERLRELARRHPALDAFLNAFHNEFGVRVSATVAMFRDDAPETVKTKAALNGFRDAVCVSAIVAGHSLTLTWKRPQGVLYSDAFDVYPWFLGRQMDETIIAFTPAMGGTHEVSHLRPQSAAGLGERSLAESHIDRPLLRELLERWRDRFATGNETAEHRRLFRSLDMARAASKMPGEADATFFDAGRAVAMWISAFEILVHDGKRADLERVLSLLNQPRWLRKELNAQDRVVVHRKKSIQTNRAGVLYKRLYDVRNDFVHGNSVTADTLKEQVNCGKSVLWFAAPLFRLALTAFLDLRISETLPETASDEDRRRHIARRMSFRAAQRLAEDAILKADEAPERTPPAG